MLIINRTPNASGAYPAPQTWSTPNIPTTHAVIPDTMDMTEFYAYNGFVRLRIVGDTVVRITPNVEAWEAWKNSQPEPEPEPPTMEERMTALEEQLIVTDETAIELYEMQLAQEEINAAQDDALIEIYELIGG